MKDTVSREVAIKLQNAGYFTSPDDLSGWSRFEWFYMDDLLISIHESRWIWDKKMWEGLIPAPTATQLFEKLPYKIGGAYLSVDKLDGAFAVTYGGDYNTDDDTYFTVRETTLPDALGLLMEYLLVNKLI